MVTNNFTTEVGDVLYLKEDIPILGLSYISGFTEILASESLETETAYFQREFRYTLDGLNWKEWLLLTEENLNAIPHYKNNIFLIEYKYTRLGDIEDIIPLGIDRIQLIAELYQSEVPNIYWKSVFGDFFRLYNIEALAWARNVLEKIYKDGILPKYIERNLDGNNNWEDEDFIDFWRSITHFFSLFVKYSRVYEDFYLDPDLLAKYLESKGLYISKNMSYDQLYTLMKAYLEQIRLRGTIQINKDFYIQSISIVPGELHRLIEKPAVNEEFVFSLMEPERYIWNIGNCSPLYKGVGGSLNTIKGYEATREANNLAYYPLIQNPPGQVVITNDWNGEYVIRFGPNCGIGAEGPQYGGGIVVNPNISYEVSFWVAFSDVETDSLYLGMSCFDKYGTSVPIYSINYFAYYDTWLPFLYDAHFIKIPYTYYFVRGILYNCNERERPDDFINVGTQGEGFNLRMDKRSYQMTVALIHGSNAEDAMMYIKNFAMRPLATDFSRGFVSVPNMILTWMKNRSKTLSNKQVEIIMRDKLLPYNSTVLNNWIQ